MSFVVLTIDVSKYKAWSLNFNIRSLRNKRKKKTSGCEMLPMMKYCIMISTLNLDLSTTLPPISRGKNNIRSSILAATSSRPQIFRKFYNQKMSNPQYQPAIAYFIQPNVTPCMPGCSNKIPVDKPAHLLCTENLTTLFIYNPSFLHPY